MTTDKPWNIISINNVHTASPSPAHFHLTAPNALLTTSTSLITTPKIALLNLYIYLPCPKWKSHMEIFHAACLRSMVGLRRGPTCPSTTELLSETNQQPPAQLLSSHRVRWLGNADHNPATAMVKQLLYADSIRPRPVGHPHDTRVEVAMQGMRTQGPVLTHDLPRGWPTLATGMGCVDRGASRAKASS